ncbi:MAG: hypothetical protein GY953_47110 [bacterium]|nr:hypothetical protein [bacterium]
MFTAIVVTPERSLSEGLGRLAVDSGQVTILRLIDHYPAPYEMVRMMNACDPELVIVDVGDWELARPVVAKIRLTFPKTAILGFGGGWGKAADVYTRSGVAALMESPITLDEFQQAVALAVRSVRGTIHKNVIAFLPAKAGSGCSLTALHTATSLAGQFSRKVIFIETDLHSGTLATRLLLSPPHYLQDVIDNPTVLNRSDWIRYVVEQHGVDLLPADVGRRASTAQWNSYFDLIDFVAATYDFVVVDLPEVVDDAMAEILDHAAAICLVTTPSRPALELARGEIVELAEKGVDRQRISLIVNRWPYAGQEVERLENALGHKVAAALPDDDDSLEPMEFEGLPVATETDLGRSYVRLAAKLAGEPMPVEPEEEKPPKRGLAALFGR